jgi:NAD(P)-dependent dehydrogenase (short-subunit alcohol dehydrogenase family)
MNANDILLTDQVAVVTGGGGGIGRGIALAMASAGADVVIGEIIPERAEETAARVRELGRRALPVQMDAMDSDQVRGLIDKAAKEFGRIDILVNNAGGVSRRLFLDQSERSWRRLIDFNLVSMLAAISAAVPVMKAGGRGGSIINVSSIEGSRAAPQYAIYAACKAAMNNLTRSLALEFGDDGIRINTIAPDHTVTPGIRGQIKGPVDPATWNKLTPEHEAGLASIIPLGREGVDTECGDAAVFLASKMASYITGVVLPVDGGTYASSGWMRAGERGWVLHD